MIFNQSQFCPGGTFGHDWRQFWLSQLRVGMLLVFSGSKLWMMINILQGQDCPPTAKTYSAPNVSSTKVEKHWFKKIFLMALSRMESGEGAGGREAC